MVALIIILILIPYVIAGIVLIFAGGIGIGCVVGLPVGIFVGVKNYMSSILGNINNGALKVTMIVIASLFVIIVLMYLAAAAYFYINLHDISFV